MATLYVVATPIGNLQDISPRAVQVLQDAAVIAAEGVNRTRKLLSHLDLGGKKLISCREANRKRCAALVKRYLDQGMDVALVSDSGTPGVSDPGSLVVEQAAKAGHRLCPIPGPSALAAALSVAGQPGAPVVFLGFAPSKQGPRRRLLEQAAQTGWPMVLFEAPHRLAKTAQDMLEVLGDRELVLARELSKVNEQVSHTSVASLAQSAAQDQARGEITLVVAGAPVENAADDEVEDLLRQGIMAGDQPPSRLARQVAAATGLAREEVYRRLLALKNEIEDQADP